MKFSLTAFLLVLFTFSYAQNAAQISKPIVDDALRFKLPYRLSEPNAELEMPDELEEISGLSLTPDGNNIVAVQDEDGEVFFINKQTGEVERDYNFHKEGDYEGVEMVGNSVFVIKSNGKIYEVHNVGEDRQQTIKFTTILNKDFDVEGLGYDAKNERLLLACKEIGEETEEPILEKRIYAFDLKTRTLVAEPVYTLRLDDLLVYLENNQHIYRYQKLVEHFTEDDDKMKFACSALAVHPQTGDIYLLSSKGKMLGVLNDKGEILHIQKLDKEIHPQPEGICFDKDGTLWISNEAKNGQEAKIYRFDVRK